MIQDLREKPGNDAKGHPRVFVQVSSDTRSMGRQSVQDHIEEGRREQEKKLDSELAEAIGLKATLEAEVSEKYGRIAYTEAQAKSRQECIGLSDRTSVMTWLSMRTKMDAEKRKLLHRKTMIEADIRRLKGALLDVRNGNRPGEDFSELLRSIIFELRQTNIHLLDLKESVLANKGRQL